jgi:hypothetical protein
LARHLFKETPAGHRVEPKTLIVHHDRGAPMVAESGHRRLVETQSWFDHHATRVLIHPTSQGFGHLHPFDPDLAESPLDRVPASGVTPPPQDASRRA